MIQKAHNDIWIITAATFIPFLQFYELTFGPSFSGPAFSAPPMSISFGWEDKGRYGSLAGERRVYRVQGETVRSLENACHT